MKIVSEPLPASRAFVLGIIGVVGSMAVAEVVLRSGVISATGLPIPSSVVMGAVDLLPDGDFWAGVGFTLGEWALGMVFATVAGVIVGGLMGAFRPVFLAFEWPIEAFRVLPAVAIAPILVLLLGGGMLPLALTVGLSCVWPIPRATELLRRGRRRPAAPARPCPDRGNPRVRIQERPNRPLRPRRQRGTGRRGRLHLRHAPSRRVGRPAVA